MVCFLTLLLTKCFELQSWICPIHCDKPSGNAFYRPSSDEIVLPMKAQFNKGNSNEAIYKDGMEFYSTALHEMAHSTGTAQRLNRLSGDKFGDPKYAKEELVAELTSAMIGNSMGFDKRILNNNAAYLDNWIGALKEKSQIYRFGNGRCKQGGQHGIGKSGRAEVGTRRTTSVGKETVQRVCLLK
jgi:hypothetical protein